MAWRRKWQTTLVFLLGKSYGQENLVGYSPWGLKESDTTKPLNLSQWPELRYICRHSMNTHTHTHTSLCVFAYLSSRVWLFVTLWIVAHQAPLPMGILQARILEWVAMSSSRGSSWPKNRTHVSCVSYIAGGFFIQWPITHMNRCFHKYIHTYLPVSL